MPHGCWHRSGSSSLPRVQTRAQGFARLRLKRARVPGPASPFRVLDPPSALDHLEKRAADLRRTLILAAFGLLAFGGGAGAPASSTIMHGPPAHVVGRVGNGVVKSTNWSGYAAYASGTTFSDVKGSWVEPAVTCPSRQKQYSSFWVGLDGYNSSSVEQTGTSSDCTGKNRPSYYAWYEMYPAAPVNLSLAIHPGDSMSAEVAASGSAFTLTITDNTTGQSFSTAQTLSSAPRTSAEWVAEAPSSCNVFFCSVLPLANFGSVNFSGSYATGNGHTGTIGDAAWSNDQIVMVTSSSQVKAQPSALSPDGMSFSDTWQHN